MKVSSRIGMPKAGDILEKYEYQQGEKIGQFTLPFNVFASASELFERFGLWHSSTGICEYGINHIPHYIGHHYVENTAPIYVGDSVLDQRVLQAESEYISSKNLWHCLVYYDEDALLKPGYGVQLSPSSQSAKRQDFKLLQSYFDTDSQMAECLLDALCALFEEVLPACLTPANGNLTTSAAIPIFTSIKERTKTRLKAILDEEGAHLWH